MLNLYRGSYFMVVKSLFHTVATACCNDTLSELDFSCNLNDLPHIHHPLPDVPDGTSTAPLLLPSPYSWRGSVGQLMHRRRLHRSPRSGSRSSVISPYLNNHPMSQRLISSTSWQQCSACWLLSGCCLQLGVITARHTASSFIGKE